MLRLAPQHTWCTWAAPETGVTLGCPWSSLSLWWGGGACTHPGLLPGLGRMVQGVQ